MNQFSPVSRLSLAGFALIVGFLVPHAAHGAFGISPPFINADHLVRGATYTQTVYLVQDNPDQTLPIKTTIEVDERVRPWIAIDKGLIFEIPQGVRQFPVQVTIQVPADTSLGVYRGKISFVGQPSALGGENGQVQIALGVQVDLNMVVGEGIYRQFSVPVVRLLDVEEGWDPRIYVKINNEGNIPEKFTGATYELLDQFGATRLAFAQKTDGFPEAPPFTSGEYVVEFPIGFHLGLGQYWGNVSFYQGDTLVATQKTVFNVLERGSLSGRMAQFVTAVREQWMYVLAGVVVLLILFFVIVRRRKKATG